MKKMRITFLNTILAGVCLVAVLTGCQKEDTAQVEEPAVTENISQTEDNASKEVSVNGYILKEAEKETDAPKEKDITDTKMSASDRTKLDNLIDEIGKEIDE